MFLQVNVSAEKAVKKFNLSPPNEQQEFPYLESIMVIEDLLTVRFYCTPSLMSPLPLSKPQAKEVL